MGHDAVALGDRLEVLADVGGIHIGDCPTCHTDRVGTNLVESGGACGGPSRHASIVPYRDT
ncbi:hypothetical protein Ade02nite_65140 [Paractinoplanes deccanensis]|uniref:Uncharacterized protein n=1 Tax=Paractinoplanes deccanensis TaxID=113561 RepID=A0ABQ3YCX8_9ACTN|nr:hypothetical protein Ade02nite_65140 [Actinoplanes deccanensis]